MAAQNASESAQSIVFNPGKREKNLHNFYNSLTFSGGPGISGVQLILEHGDNFAQFVGATIQLGWF
jgi:hypothetical protein